MKTNEFYGFNKNFDENNTAKLHDLLCCESSCPIYEHDTDKEVVEEIVRREGTFYTGPEARSIIPWKQKNDVCVAKIKYLDTEIRPQNPGFAECDWIVLNPLQYVYGVYLQKQIADGKLTLEDIKETRPGRKRMEI